MDVDVIIDYSNYRSPLPYKQVDIVMLGSLNTETVEDKASHKTKILVLCLQIVCV